MEIKKLHKEQLLELILDMESEIIERTTSVTDTDKFAQAICAFSNDLPNNNQKGCLLIGVKDDGELSGFKATDKFLQNMGGLRSDGNILPQPIISIKTTSLKKGDVVIIEVTPSPFPPVRYKGKTWIRIGPRKAVAGEIEERILIERRSSNMSMFDMRPCSDSNINDLDIELFKNNYLPRAINKEILKSDKRDIKEQLAALRFYNIEYDKPTNAGILLFGNNPEYFIPGGYIQFVRFKDESLSSDILNEKKFTGNLINTIKLIDSFIDNAIVTQRPIPFSTLQEVTKSNYPNWALRELIMNAVMHRDYESNAPIKFYQFKNRIELGNAGGLYGKARPENFPNENDYRNPVIAEAMKILGYVNRFNRGIERVKEQLLSNGNPQPIFDYNKVSSFGVTVKDNYDTLSIEKEAIETDSFENQLIEFGRNSEEIRKKFGLTALKILKIVFDKPDTTAQIMAGIISVTSRTIEKNIAKLKDEGIIIREGSTKKGYWKIN